MDGESICPTIDEMLDAARPVLEVLPIGAHVTVGGEIPGIVSAITIRDCFTYEVTWWDGRIRRCEWLSPHEIVAKSGTRKSRLGFTPDA